MALSIKDLTKEQASSHESVRVWVDGKEERLLTELSLRQSLIAKGYYIPGVCDHPDLKIPSAFEWSETVWQGETQYHHKDAVSEAETYIGSPTKPSCNLCWVEVKGEGLVKSCEIVARENGEILTQSPAVIEKRKEALKKLLATHPHACLTCPHREGCDRIQCSMNVPLEERCCELLGRCEIGKVADWIGIPPDTPSYRNLHRQCIDQDPLFIRDYELCISCGRCVRVCDEIRGARVLGAVWDGEQVRVGTRTGALLEASRCLFCTLCVSVCPTGALRDHKEWMYPSSGIPPCVERCPLKIDIPGYVSLIAQGDIDKAYDLIREKALLPGVLGYACFHPCEDVCRHKALNQSIAICALKRYVADRVSPQPLTVSDGRFTGVRVAVVGSGPAGLAAAGELIKNGCEVTLFEEDDRLGGMLAQAIPDFRLPEEVVEREIKTLIASGLKVQLGVKITNPQDLLDGGYSAVIWATGRKRPLRLGVPVEEIQGVVTGLDYLREAKKIKVGGSPLLGFTKGGLVSSEKVVVIGGGAVAVDCAMVAKRLGAREVTIICLEKKGQMPAHPEELELALEEGILIMDGWGVEQIEETKGINREKGEYIYNDEGRFRIRLKRCIEVYDAQGRFSPQFDLKDTVDAYADFIIVAIGQTTDEITASLSPQNGVFFCGDGFRGPTSIVEAMADGIRAAKETIAYLEYKLPGISHGTYEYGDHNSREYHSYLDHPVYDTTIHSESVVLSDRVEAVRRSVEERIRDFSVIIKTYNDDEARQEALRCLRCDLRASLSRVALPPDPWIIFPPFDLNSIPHQPGVVILADERKKPVLIEGSNDLHSLINDKVNERFIAAYCRWEIDPMFTQRESELIQAHIKMYGALPQGSAIDDLFD